MMKDLRFRYEKRPLITGALFILAGIFTPAVLGERTFHIYDSLGRAMLAGDTGLLLFTAVKLVLMNSLRALPHYMGAFIVSDACTLSWKGKRVFPFNVVCTFGIILLVYFLINLFFGIHYDFGMPAILLVCLILLLSYMDLFAVNFFNKIITVSSLLLSIQWLDVVPHLHDAWFGRGEISHDIKIGAALMNSESSLTIFAVSLCIAFLLSFAIQVQLLNRESRLRSSALREQQMLNDLHQTQMQALTLRSFGEVQSLVHDLKTPLTTVQGLVSLSELMETDPKIRQYLARISNSVTGMSQMISEILYEDKRTVLTTDELFRLALAQISIRVPQTILTFTNDCPQAKLCGNRIRLSRAILNVVFNSWQAVDHTTGSIKIHVFKKICGGIPGIAITVWDNGCGMNQQALAHVFEPGYSRTHSTGLGLGFTRQVIEKHEGKIQIDSKPREFTCVTIWFKEAQNERPEGNKGSDD